ALVVHTGALDLAFRARGLVDAMFTRDADDGGRERHPTMARLDLVKTEDHGAVQSAIDLAHVAGDPMSARDDLLVGRNQVFLEFALEVLATLHLASVERVAQADGERG